MTDAHPPSSPSPEPIDFSRPPECRMNVAFLCNPNDEDPNLRGHHTSELFSDELDDIEKRASAKGCNGLLTIFVLIT